jgi:hypothetical protein
MKAKLYLALATLYVCPHLFSMAVTQVNGDSGSATGPIITLATGAATNANGTANFLADGSAITLIFSDQDSNMGLGQNALVATKPNVGALYNISIGDYSGEFVTSGYNNIMIGVGAGGSLTTGDTNVLIGYAAGSAYVGGESGNTLINDNGQGGEFNVIRISSNASGQGTTACYIGGITGVTVANQNLVTIDSQTGQLGSVSAITNPSQPAFLAYLSTTNNNVTGDGTVYTIGYDTETYDRDSNFEIYNGIFTAPITGVYHFEAAANLSGLFEESIATLDLVTNDLTYRLAAETLRATAATDTLAGGVTIAMSAGDTAYIAVTVNVSTEIPIVNVVGGANPVVTYFSGLFLS